MSFKIEAGGKPIGLNLPEPTVKEVDAAKKFEGLLLEQMLKSMWSTVEKDKLMGGGREEEYFRDFFNQALSESISEGKGIGVKDVILQDMLRQRANGEKD